MSLLYDPAGFTDASEVTEAEKSAREDRVDISVTPDITQIFITCQPRLLKLAEKILGARHTAEDIVQDAFIKALHAAKVSDIRYPTSYLHRIVRNLAIDRLRKEALDRRNLAEEDEGLYVSEPSQNPETILIDLEHLRMVNLALRQLPERSQTAFTLYSTGDHTQREIAKKLNVSATLVNFMIRDVLKHCRMAFPERG